MAMTVDAQTQVQKQRCIVLTRTFRWAQEVQQQSCANSSKIACLFFFIHHVLLFSSLLLHSFSSFLFSPTLAHFFVFHLTCLSFSLSFLSFFVSLSLSLSVIFAHKAIVVRTGACLKVCLCGFALCFLTYPSFILLLCLFPRVREEEGELRDGKRQGEGGSCAEEDVEAVCDGDLGLLEEQRKKQEQVLIDQMNGHVEGAFQALR